MSKVFISYVHENTRDVQRLVNVLTEHDVEVWFDKTHLRPGDRWRDVIRREIAAGDFFLACFSSEYNNRTRGFVFEELTQAVEQIRQRRHDQPWLIPVLLSPCEIPDIDIGGGQTLHAFQWVTLYANWDEGVRRILSVVRPLAPHFINSIGMEFVLIQAGEFVMGSSSEDIDRLAHHYNLGDLERKWIRYEVPQHQVRISQPFYLGMYPVTQAQWQEVIRNSPRHSSSDPTLPVEEVSWEEAREFFRTLNEREGGLSHRLPTEAEWEYACRAGSTTAYSFGDDPNHLSQYAWYSANSGRKTHPVGRLKPNAWGLYDMYGNVGEWVQDWEENYSSEYVIDPQGPPSGDFRGVRGGSCIYDAWRCRSATRSGDYPTNQLYGLRLLRIARSLAHNIA